MKRLKRLALVGDITKADIEIVPGEQSAEIVLKSTDKALHEGPWENPMFYKGGNENTIGFIEWNVSELNSLLSVEDDETSDLLYDEGVDNPTDIYVRYVEIRPEYKQTMAFKYLLDYFTENVVNSLSSQIGKENVFISADFENADLEKLMNSMSRNFGWKWTYDYFEANDGIFYVKDSVKTFKTEDRQTKRLKRKKEREEAEKQQVEEPQVQEETKPTDGLALAKYELNEMLKMSYENLNIQGEYAVNVDPYEVIDAIDQSFNGLENGDFEELNELEDEYELKEEAMDSVSKNLQGYIDASGNVYVHLPMTDKPSQVNSGGIAFNYNGDGVVDFGNTDFNTISQTLAGFGSTLQSIFQSDSEFSCLEEGSVVTKDIMELFEL